MSLEDFFKWFNRSRLYFTYVGFDNQDFVYDLSLEEKMNFMLLVWHSEGCPDIE